MPVNLSYSQLLAVMSRVERSELSGGLVIARPEDAALLVFDYGVLLHAELTRTRGRDSKGPAVLDELVGKRQASLAWVWPDEHETVPDASVTAKEASIFRRSLRMLARYGYFDDPQATTIAAEFFGVPEEALADALADAPSDGPVLLAATELPSPAIPNARAQHLEELEAAEILAEPTAVADLPALKESIAAATPIRAGLPEVADAAKAEVAPMPAQKTKKTKEKAAARSVIANPQTALGKLIFNKALLTEVPLTKRSRSRAEEQQDATEETNDKK